MKIKEKVFYKHELKTQRTDVAIINSRIFIAGYKKLFDLISPRMIKQVDHYKINQYM